ncbi:hypothetical protein AB0O76_40815 [Streptomyces sp. NPDC086554]|uniref:hypothetical protein n=1 Tax=Streptomyces sp. NPDC086554 TaxID=3154864 RepID=UPI003414BA44
MIYRKKNEEIRNLAAALELSQRTVQNHLNSIGRLNEYCDQLEEQLDISAKEYSELEVKCEALSQVKDNRPKLDENDLEEIWQLYNDVGCTYHEIARAYEVHPSTVGRALDRMEARIKAEGPPF